MTSLNCGGPEARQAAFINKVRVIATRGDRTMPFIISQLVKQHNIRGRYKKMFVWRISFVGR